MKIAYLDLSSFSDENAGYKKKIKNQISALNKLGVEVIAIDIALGVLKTKKIKT